MSSSRSAGDDCRAMAIRSSAVQSSAGRPSGMARWPSCSSSFARINHSSLRCFAGLQDSPACTEPRPRAGTDRPRVPHRPVPTGPRRGARCVARSVISLLYDVGDEKHFDLRQSSAHALGIGHASRQAATEHEERSKVARLDLVDQRDGLHLPELPWQLRTCGDHELRTCGDHEGMPRGTAARSKTRYAVRLTVPRRGGWRAWGADFERALADVADPAIASAEIASELRRGADYIRVSVVLTVVTTDVCSSQRIASSHQAGSGATLPA